MARQHTAGRRRPDATRFAEQKLRADLMLHVADPFACGGRSYVCVASTLRDTRRFRHTQEQTEIRQIKTHVSVSTVLLIADMGADIDVRCEWDGPAVLHPRWGLLLPPLARYFRSPASIAASTLGGDIGSSVSRVPTARSIALAMAAIGGQMLTSATPLAPYG